MHIDLDMAESILVTFHITKSGSFILGSRRNIPLRQENVLLKWFTERSVQIIAVVWRVCVVYRQTM